MDFLNKGINFYLALFLGLTLIPVFMTLGEQAALAFNASLVALNVAYLTLGNTIVTVVRLAPYGIVVAIIGAVVIWIKGGMGKKGF